VQIKYSNHALERMEERNISKEQVEKTLTPPTNIKSGRGEKFVATKNGIRVVYVVTDKTILVVTVTWE